MDSAAAFRPMDDQPGDPTQRLLTALGRFQRQIARARDGLPQEAWSDECMNQLINAVEIALGQGWKEVVRTLTETARILQSYEDAGQAHRCTGFLAESYEILCLMVGDLIVGNVRSGVVEKWDQRYARAVEEVRAAGIPLVEDADRPEPTARPPQSFIGVVSPTFEEEVDEVRAPWALQDSPAPVVEPLVDDLPTLDELLPLEPEAEPVVENGIERAFAPLQGYPPRAQVAKKAPEREAPAEPVQQNAEPLGIDLPEPQDLAEPETEDELDRAVESLIDEMAIEPTQQRIQPAEDAEAAEDDEAVGVTGRRDLPPDVVDALDALCDDLSRLATNGARDSHTLVSRVESGLALLEQHAVDQGRDGAVLPCLAMGRMVRLMTAQEAEPDDRFFELAYAFCGLYAEAGQTAPSSVQDWLSECDDLLVSWAERARTLAEAEVEDDAPALAAAVTEAEDEGLEPVAEIQTLEEEPVVDAQDQAFGETWDDGYAAPTTGAGEPMSLVDTVESGDEEIVEVLDSIADKPAPSDAGLDIAVEDEEPDDSPQGLLQTASRAALAGNTTNAKVLAMQAVARIAETQVHEAEGKVARTEALLQQGAVESEQARERVREAEQSVEASERLVEERQQHVQASQGRCAAVAEELRDIDVRIEDLDAQIRALQEQRAAAVQEQIMTDRRLAETRAEERDAEEALAQCREEEQDARVNLEGARQAVKALERKRAETEASMERAREVLARQRSSYEDLERTISQVCSLDASDEDDQNGALF